MNKYVIKGFLIGILIVPIASLGLAIRFIEVSFYPLILVPKYIVTGFIDVSSFPGILSIGLMALVSGLFYALIGYIFNEITTKTKKTIGLGFLILLYIALTGLANIPLPDKGFTQTVPRQTEDIYEGRTGQACRVHEDCPLPVDYAIRSNCPFQGACIEGSCAVVCPVWEHSPNPEESISYEVMCTADSECNCSDWDSEGNYECLCIDGQCGAVVER